jgi:hypothetical protein
MIRSISKNATMKPTIGDNTIGIRTLSTMADQFTELLEASAAPTRPPIRACDDEEGNPKYQVVRFHTMAPPSAARITTRPSSPLGGVITSDTVLATSWPSSAPAKFITAAIVNAMRGVSARVEMDVAMALAAS